MKKVIIASLGAFLASLLVGACGSKGTTADKNMTRDAYDSVPSPTWKCSDSSYGGVQYLTCAGGTSCAGRHASPDEYCEGGVLFYCENGEARKVMCPDGCIGNPLGTDDECR